MTKYADYYSAEEGPEELTYEVWEELVTEVILNEPVEHWPEEFTCYAYDRKPITDAVRKRLADAVLETTCDHLMEQEEMGEPGEGIGSDDAMVAAAAEYAKKALEDFVPWACERAPAKDITMPTYQFVLKYEPGWMDEPAVKAWVEKQRAEHEGDG